MFFFFFNDTATTEIYTLSLHDALPILLGYSSMGVGAAEPPARAIRSIWMSCEREASRSRDRKSTRLNSSHANISYAVFCLKKKKKKRTYPARHINLYRTGFGIFDRSYF